MSRKDAISRLIISHNRSLQKLKEQKASFGLHTPHHILIEIEDISAEIEKLQTELNQIEIEATNTRTSAANRKLRAVIGNDNAPEEKQLINPILILSLSIPVSVLYIVFLWLTRTSLPWAAIGYATMGLSFGVLQSLFRVRRPYDIAFCSTALVPFLAYLFIAVVSMLNVILRTGPVQLPNPSGGVIEILPESYFARHGMLPGIILFAFVTFAILVVPFGFIGVAGRFLGDELSHIINLIMTDRVIPKQLNGKLLDSSISKPVKVVRASSFVIITIATVTSLISIFVALFK